MKTSVELQAKIDELGLKKENILYLNIAGNFLKEILDGDKQVEFRAFSDFYSRKINKIDKEGNYVSTKPLTHILFQAGYNADSPRVLIELKNILIMIGDTEGEDFEPEAIDYSKPNGSSRLTIEQAVQDNPRIFEEAEFEGFTLEDNYIAFLLGKIKFTERLKTN